MEHGTFQSGRNKRCNCWLNKQEPFVEYLIWMDVGVKEMELNFSGQKGNGEKYNHVDSGSECFHFEQMDPFVGPRLYILEI